MPPTVASGTTQQSRLATSAGTSRTPPVAYGGDGLGVNGGKWKKYNGVAPTSPPQPPQPSKQTPAGKAATEKRAADKKLQKENDALRKELEQVKADKDDAGGEIASSPQAAVGQDLKNKIAALEVKEKKLKALLDEEQDDDIVKKMAGVQAELAAARGQVRLAKDPADIVHDETKLIAKMEKERADIDKKFYKAREAMQEAEDHWRMVGAQLLENDAKIRASKERQQEALHRRPGLETSRVDV